MTETTNNPDARMTDADRWAIIKELLCRGYHRHEWDYDSDTKVVTFECYDIRVQAADTDGCLRAMVAATNPTIRKLGPIYETPTPEN